MVHLRAVAAFGEQLPELLEELRGEADILVDTSNVNVHELRERLRPSFADDGEATRLQTSIVSFGYKHGLPLDVDLVFDCRFLPNPHWIESLRPLSGIDEPVREYVLAQPETALFLAELDRMFALLLPAFERERKSYLSIGVGCTGGQHRSVVMAEELAFVRDAVAHAIGRRERMPAPAGLVATHQHFVRRVEEEDADARAHGAQLVAGVSELGEEVSRSHVDDEAVAHRPFSIACQLRDLGD